MNALFLVIAFSLNAAANILLKYAALNSFSFSALIRMEFSIAHLYAFAAALLFALNLGFYLLALRSVPLSVGYPVMIGMTFVLTTGAALLLGERISLAQAIGLGMILLGVIIAVRGA
jgi:multidrug transporter EmrE-like cation transporter